MWRTDTTVFNPVISPEHKDGNYADDGWVMATAGLIGCGGDTTVFNPVISTETGGGNYADDGWMMATAGLIWCGGQTPLSSIRQHPQRPGLVTMLMMVG